MISTRAFAISLAAATLLLGAILYYFQSKISAITDLSNSHLGSGPFVLQTPAAETREINLGFSHFSLPATVPGTPVQMHGTLFVNFVSENTRPILTICPPRSEREETFRSFLAQFRAFTEDTSASWFAAQRKILETQTFNVFGAIRKGRRASIRDLTLLVMKGLQFGAARNAVRIFENQITGAFIYTTARGEFIEVYDKAAGVSQLFIVSPEAGGIDTIASAIIQTYHAEIGEHTETQLLEKLHATGIPNLPAPSFEPGNKAEEEERLKMVAEDVRKQHLKASK
jgi:hypothetical protein